MAPGRTGRLAVVCAASIIATVVAGGVAALVGARPAAAALSVAPSPVPAFGFDSPDPDLVRDGNTYYVFTTGTWWGNNLGALVDTSGSPQSGWGGYTPTTAAGSSALPVAPAWEQPGTQWSPGVFYWGGRWVMYYSASLAGFGAGTGHSCLSMATASSLSPRPIFTDNSSGPMYCLPAFGGAIDAHPFVDPTTGAAWLLWKSNDGGSTLPAVLWTAQLSADGTAFVSQPTALLAQDTAHYPWETTIESPQMIFANGTYYLLYSGGAWSSPNYGAGYAVCAGPVGPCTRAQAGPFLASYDGVAGPGAPSMTADASGRWWIAYDGWSAGCTSYTCGGARRLFVVPVGVSAFPFAAASEARFSPVYVGGLVHTYKRAVDGHLTEFLADHQNGRIWNAYDLTAAAAGPVLAGDPVPIAPGDVVRAYARDGNGHLVEFASDHLNGRIWNAYDLSVAAGGPALAGDPFPVAIGGAVRVYGRDIGGDLVEFVSDHLNGRIWNAYDLTAAGAGPQLGGDPFAAVSGSAVQVYVRAGYGNLVEFTSDHLNGRIWNAYDLTAAGAGPALAGDPAGVMLDIVGHVYAVSASGDLVEFTSDHLNGRIWNAYDLTAAGAGPQLVGDPAPVVLGAAVHVYVPRDDGNLVEFVSDHQNGRIWNAYDLTGASGGPALAGDPAPLPLGPVVHAYATAAGGDLFEFMNDGLNGRIWNAYDQTANSAGPKVAP
jgi:hypothetical protein